VILEGERGPRPVPWLVREIDPMENQDKDKRLYLCPLQDLDEESLGVG